MSTPRTARATILAVLGLATVTGTAVHASAPPGDTSAAGASVECPESSPGLTDSTIKLGGTYPLSGPAAAYGTIPRGVDAWFQHLNDTAGGFQLSDGTTLEIEWVYFDDGYEPPRAVENARRLVEQEEVFAVFNPLGTPPNTAIRDYMNAEEVPQLLVATGASTWGNESAEYPWTIGFQPDYQSEGIAYVKHILAENPDATIGVLYQNDDFGADYLVGITAALEAEGKGDQLVAEVSYEVTDTTVDNQVSQIQASGADALIAVVTPQFAIQTIQRKVTIGWEPEFFVISSVSSSVGAVMQPAGPENAVGTVTSVYLKDPTDPAFAEDPAIIEYRELLAEYHSDADPDDGFNVYGMSVAQTLEYVIESVEGPLCRASLMETVRNFTWEQPPLLLDGISVETNAAEGDAFPIQEVQMQRWNGETWERFGDVIDPSL